MHAGPRVSQISGNTKGHTSSRNIQTIDLAGIGIVIAKMGRIIVLTT